MKNNASRIGLILILVIVFPTLFFSVYELNSIKSNKAVVDSIYASQLKNIAASINQYSVDVMEEWADDIDNENLINNDWYHPDSIINNIKFNKPICGIFLNDSSQVSSFYRGEGILRMNNVNSIFIDNILSENESTIKKLHRYIENGYRKIENISIDIDELAIFIFALKNKSESINAAGIIIDKSLFITEILAPKIQSMAQNNFVISIMQKGEVLYSNSKDFSSAGDLRLTNPLWIMDDLDIGIRLIDDPVEQMIKQRSRVNLILIIIMDIILLTGAFFVYRTLRQQLKLAQLKSEFISNVSHEIKTPLALISMYSETLEMNRIPTEEKKLEYFRVINKESQRLMRMVNKILSFSKIESGTRTFNFVETDINDIVHRVVDTYKHHFISKGVEYSVNYADDLPLINADEEAVVDAVTNLIDNGIKYSDAEKNIQITTGILNGRVFVSVKDSGIGIKDKDQKHVFDKFYRVTDGNLALMAKGSGIGLNIVKDIVSAHSGHISLKSKFGEGSTFTLNFPTI